VVAPGVEIEMRSRDPARNGERVDRHTVRIHSPGTSVPRSSRERTHPPSPLSVVFADAAGASVAVVSVRAISVRVTCISGRARSDPHQMARSGDDQRVVSGSVPSGGGLIGEAGPGDRNVGEDEPIQVAQLHE
jgi:hypothetical protein